MDDNFLAIQTSGLTKEFDGLVAVKSIDWYITKGELFSLLGPNGAVMAAGIHLR